MFCYVCTSQHVLSCSFYLCLDVNNFSHNLFNVYLVFSTLPPSPDLCVILKKNSSAYLHSLVDSKRETSMHSHTAWHSLTLTDTLLHTQSRRQTDMQHLYFLSVSSSPWVVRQPIFALACCYLRGGGKVVMEGWLRPVTSCSFALGTLSGKVMAKPARCSSHF